MSGKKNVFLLFVFIGFSVCCGAVHKLASGGRTDYVIVLPADAIPSEQTAGRELQSHLKQMTGAEFPVVPLAEYAGGPAFMIGFNERLPEALRAERYPGLGPEEFVIDSDERVILLSGGRPRGALYATYEFLERLGVRWFTPTEATIPQRPELSIDVVAERYTSQFKTRTNVLGNGTTREWSARNRMNSFLEWLEPGEEYGRGILQGPDMDCMWRYLDPALFRDYPEWAAMVDGKRIVNTSAHHWGACFSNAQLRGYLIEKVLDWLRKHPDYTHVWFAQNDGSPYCQCPDCQALYDAHGGAPSAGIVLLLGEMAERVKAEFPHVGVKTLAYAWSLQPPTGMRLGDNVTVMFCASFDWFMELGVDEPTLKVIDYYHGWQPVASEFEVYLYNHPTSSVWFPAACLYNQARNVKRCKDLGFTAIHQEIYGPNTGDGGEYVDLRAWLFTRLAWRPDADIEGLIQDFCRNYYGPRADDILYAIHRTEESHAAGWRPPHDNVSFAAPGYLEPAVVEDVLPRLRKAYDEEADPVIKKRVGYVMLAYMWADFWMGMRGTGRIDPETNTWSVDFADRERRKVEGAQIKRLMIENNVSALHHEGGRFNPHTLQLSEMCQDYAYVQFGDGDNSVTLVPGLFGRMTEFSRGGLDIIKGLYGDFLMEYPTVGYGSDRYLGVEPKTFQVESSDAASAVLATTTSDGRATKQFAIRDGALDVTLSLTAAHETAEGSISTCPQLNLNPDGHFGIYPKLYLSTADGWRMFAVGTVGTLWWQQGTVDLTGYTGRMVLVSEDGSLGLEILTPADNLKTLGFMYDRWDFEPKGSGNVLDLGFTSMPKKLAAGETMSLKVTYRILKQQEIPAFENVSNILK